MTYLMGIDLGTSSLKVVLLAEDGALKQECSSDYKFSSPQAGYAESDVELWWKACCQTIRQALQLSGIHATALKGISFSGQMHGAVFLDQQRKPIRPAILHCDARSGPEALAIRQSLGIEVLEQVVLNQIYPGFLLPSLVWVKEHERANYERIRTVLLPKDYLKYKLTGRLISDFSDASGTLLFDQSRLTWSADILDKLGLPRRIFPDCDRTTAVIGEISAAAAELTGLRAGTPVVNGGADQIMQAIGSGAIEAGAATVNIGSSGQVCFQTNRPILNPKLSTNTFCGFEPGRWITMGATMTAGLSLKWFTSLFGAVNYSELDQRVADLKPGSGGLIFLPYLNGERTPHLNPDLSGVFLGLTPTTSREQLARAVMEGVAYSLRQCLETCAELGLTASELIASGGGARSAPWLQLQADIYGIPLKVAAIKQQAALGAAIAAGAGVGVFDSVSAGCARAVSYQARRYIPNAENRKVYQEYYRLFKETYLAGREVIEGVTLLGRTSS